jgi:hypothetical protein
LQDRIRDALRVSSMQLMLEIPVLMGFDLCFHVNPTLNLEIAPGSS